ncbi:uncharacterized protein N7483_010284 [Penicillium malachiteum]|uniref:uncharacterized protein n=1 Tax=Penicillium malachiteum TaxID=1324776 RepID=UPI002548972A|nr:uncharacterized protein N7483_010284 [Penicillium malachiteum]KAJ5713103.1 hypothetical protein N7483_010284 [Penicillium malachiteum]
MMTVCLQKKFRHYETKCHFWKEKSVIPDDNDNDSVDVHSTVFFDPLEILYCDQNKNGQLGCHEPLLDLDNFIASHQEISFIVFCDYDRHYETNSPWTEDASPQVPDTLSESISPVVSDLKDAFQVIFQELPGLQDIEIRHESTGEIVAPYHFLYHNWKQLDQFNNRLSQSAQNHLNLFLTYVREKFGDEYATVDLLLKEGNIMPRYLNYLFKPGDVIVEANGSSYVGYIASSWVTIVPDKSNSEDEFDESEILTGISGLPIQTKREKQKRKSKISSANTSQTVKAWNLDFDGNFFRTFKTLMIEITYENPTETANEDDKPSICQDINAIRETLKRRGNTFWKCRDRRLVSYHREKSDQDVEMTDERYMIDMDTYRKLHPAQRESSAGLKHNINAAAINDPNGKYQLLLPLNLKGYNLRHKKWFEISADRISDVKWNREAFQSLVMERKSKELVQALVTNQIETEKATDLIPGKGNGLILLLHGGPGTGKTLTAESVAEITQKPLNRVTCSNVGTKAEQAEKYLESVLSLGRHWGCVVLLDEADVFLEKRSLEDLERNALVATFIDRLSSMSNEEQIDIDDLRDNLHLLKEMEMNGRQIRNVIATARQYAKWKEELLTYEYLKDVIEISGRFDTYLNKLHGGFSDDEIAQGDGLRLA